MRKQRIPLTFERGAVDRYSPSMLEAGEAAAIRNWVPEPNGQLRMRHGWVNYPTTGAPAFRDGRGMHHHAWDVENPLVFAATQLVGANTVEVIRLKNYAGSYQYLKLTNVDPLASGTFTLEWDGETSAAITWDADPATVIANIQAALDGLATGADYFDVCYAAQLPGARNNIQTINLYDAIGGGLGVMEGGSFTLTFDGQTTDAINIPGATNTLVQRIKSKLEALSNIEPDEVTVAMAPISTSQYQQLGAIDIWQGFKVEFSGQFIYQQQPQMTIDGTNLTGRSGYDETLVSVFDGIRANGEDNAGRLLGSQRADYPGYEIWIRVNDKRSTLLFTVDDSSMNTPGDLTCEEWIAAVAPGVFNLSLDGYGTTADIDSEMGASVIAAALLDLHDDLGATVTQSFDGTDLLNTVEFDGNLAGTEVAMMTAAVVSGPTGFSVSVEGQNTGYSIYLIDPTDPAAAWVHSTDVQGHGSVPLYFASGADALVVVSPGDSMYAMTSTGWATLTPPFDPYALAYHKSRFFSADDTTLWYSRLLDYANWTDETTSADNTIPVGALDGERLESLGVHEDLLIIGKRNSIWMLSGSSSSTFALRRMVGGGVAPGKALCSTPYGMVAAGVDAVWLYNGGPWRDISSDISESYGMTGNFLTTAYCNGCLYIADEGSGVIWVYNFETGAWSTEVPGDTDEGPVLVYAKADILYSQPSNAQTNSLVMYRQMPQGARACDPNMSETLFARTGEMWLGSPVAPATIRQLNLRLRQSAGNAGQGDLVITPYVDGQAGTPQRYATTDELGSRRERMSLGGTGWGIYFEFSQELAAGEDGGFDIEEAILEIDLEEER